ncbi:DEAD/DEAH box helicase family protein [Mycoplasma sp. CSL7475-4]|uniref:type I restriction enzyme subunit R domain-containing protein n=1 Tax=Mycoplasma sp. CSL7475-4 TaxID=2973942 RepID=UPI00216AE778|nr:DEAD/DEAH box helicase family protein [Mycoplasma sp. CSL7475-4]MCS4536990.1 DEAD/DEAH box helicase family protein [Mycoplasma sp. CSL7475-4]
MAKSKTFFQSEKEFQEELVNKLINEGKWKNLNDYGLADKFNNIDEEVIWQNWRKILNIFNVKWLGDYPLTDEEFKEVKKQVFLATTKVSKANEALKTGLIAIKRLEKRSKYYDEVIYLRFFPTGEVNPAENIYQVATEVTIQRGSGFKSKKRLDLVLLINGIPLYHIELKQYADKFQDAVIQIKNYHTDKIYEGLFGFVQVLVAMVPNKMWYWPNATNSTEFETNIKNAMHWADFDNKIVNDWETIASQFLSIPASHKLVQNYSIGNNEDDELILLRSYQFHAVERILSKFSRSGEGIWDDVKTTDRSIKAGYVWHTTGSGKTLTSFMTSRLLLDHKHADRVIFVVDRISLNNQTKNEFNRFENRGSNEGSLVSVPKNSADLYKLLKNDDNKIVITTINKLDKMISENKVKTNFAKLKDKRYVFIFDEAHRSTSGSQLASITEFFSSSAIIGFTGTPIFEKNSKNNLTTEDIFGKDRIHQYTILDGIRDRKVLKFNIDYVTMPEVITFYTWIKQNNRLLNLQNEDELNQNIKEFVKNYEEIREGFNNSTDSLFSKEWHDIEGIMNIQSNDPNLMLIEDKILDAKYYDNVFYKNSVAKFILNDWFNRSSSCNFSALFATSSIADAIQYYNIFQELNHTSDKKYKITTIFDDSLDVVDDFEKNSFKIDAIQKIVKNYNEDFKTNFSAETYKDGFKNDVLQRLARKGIYNNLRLKRGVNKELDEKKLDIVIVVSQLLTGYDSKYINTVYFDKIVKMEGLVQAFSRTNRVLDDVSYKIKDFGNIVCFRAPHRMKHNVKEAFAEYAHANDWRQFQTITDSELVLSQINTYKKIKATLQKISRTDENNNIEILISDEDAENFELLSEFSNLVTNVTQLISNKNSISIRNSLSKLKDKEEYEEYQSYMEEINDLIPRLKSAIRSVNINDIIDNNNNKKNKPLMVVIDLDKVDFITKSETINEMWLKQLEQQIADDVDLSLIIQHLSEHFTKEQIDVFIANWEDIRRGKNFIDVLKNHEIERVKEYTKNFGLDFEKVWNLYTRTQGIDENNGWEDLTKDYVASAETRAYCNTIVRNYRGAINTLKVKLLAREELEKLRNSKNNDF